MGYELRRWLRDQLPADLPSGELLVALEIADRANDQSRRCWPELAELAAACRMAPASVSRHLRGLGRRGWELREPVRTGRDGRPVYAHTGHKITFLVPTERAD